LGKGVPEITTLSSASGPVIKVGYFSNSHSMRELLYIIHMYLPKTLNPKPKP
jgi:hypothetical protein